MNADHRRAALPGDNVGLFIGLMTGTSMDAVDAALVRLGPSHTDLVATHATVLPAALQERLRAAAAGDPIPIDLLGELDTELAGLLATAARSTLDAAGVAPAQVTAIGSHGQTLRHRPDAAHPFTLQIGDPARIAALTGIPTVADFRRRDLVAGGQGAPLAPVLHRRLLAGHEGVSGVLNLGGIGNLTVIDNGRIRTAFDSGPANTLLDAWCRRHLQQPCDRDGAWAREGSTHPGLLEALLADPWLARPPPRSTGPEHFNLAWLDRVLAGLAPIDAADVITTLTEFSAVTIAEGVNRSAPDVSRLYLCGGGVHNPTLRARLAHHLPAPAIDDTTVLGIPPQWIEACAFAWLARCRMTGEALQLMHVTGAREPVILGGLYLP